MKKPQAGAGFVLIHHLEHSLLRSEPNFTIATGNDSTKVWEGNDFWNDFFFFFVALKTPEFIGN